MWSAKNSRKTVMAKKNPIPNSTPFQKGQSGNPNGRPKGRLNLKTILEKYLEAEVTHTTVEGEAINIPAIDAMVLKQIAKAREGDTPAFRELMDRLEGKPKSSDTLDVTVKKIVVKTPDDKE